MTKLLRFIGILTLCGLLSACFGGGGGDAAAPPPAAPPATTLSGTVTDTELDPVAGTTVQILGTSSSTTTDAAGRYSFTGQSAGVEYTLKYSGPSAEYFPTFAKATLTEDTPTVLDGYLARAGDIAPPTVDASAGGAAVSIAYIQGPLFATLTLTANELQDTNSAAYTGTATVYIAPIDVGQLGYGLASYEPGLGTVFTALTASSGSVDLYAAAAVKLVDGSGNALSLIAPSTSTLTLPIPANPAYLRTNAPASVSLWHLNESTGAWVQSGTATKDGGGESYTGVISRTGVWLAGTSSTLTAMTGTVYYNDTTPAPGTTVYITGVDYGYQMQTTTSGTTGSFSFLAKATGTITIHCVVAANGAQWTYERNFTNPTGANIILPFAPPTANGTATATVTVDDRDSTVGNGPDVLGYVLASGRQLSDPSTIADVTADNIGNFVFVANQLSVVGPISLEPSDNGSGIQVVSGSTFASLSTAPTTGYITTPTAYAVNLDPSTATFPILLAVKTDKGHYGKISIDSVTSLNAPNNNEWQITFRHAFSLTGTF